MASNTEYTVTYVVENGTWSDGTTGAITETVLEGNAPSNIPVGMIPNAGYEGGAWNVDPSTSIIRENTTFTYSFVEIQFTVTYIIINGKWYDGKTTPKTEKVKEGESPARIPKDMIPLWGYGDGSWSPDPYGAVITADVSYTYEFVEMPDPQPKPEIPRMAKVIPYYRLRGENQVSEWIQKGEYYINTRSTTSNFDNLNIMEAQCFDNMIKANATYMDKTSIDFNRSVKPTDLEVIADVCNILGFVQDSRNAEVLTKGYTMDVAPSKYSTCREVLGSIAALYGANWIFTDEGKLRIVPLISMGDTLNIRKSASNVTESPKRHGYTKVTMRKDTWNEQYSVSRGTSDDKIMEVTCLWPLESAVTDVYNKLSNWEYRPITAQGVWADPAVELGDTVDVGGDRATNQFTAYSREIDFASGTVMELSAPNDNYIDNEYLFQSPKEEEINKLSDYISDYIGTINDEIEIINNEFDNIEDIYPLDGFNTVVLNETENIGTDWTKLNTSYVIPEDGWYMIEGSLKYNSDAQAPSGIAIGVYHAQDGGN